MPTFSITFCDARFRAIVAPQTTRTSSSENALSSSAADDLGGVPLAPRVLAQPVPELDLVQRTVPLGAQAEPPDERAAVLLVRREQPEAAVPPLVAREEARQDQSRTTSGGVGSPPDRKRITAGSLSSSISRSASSAVKGRRVRRSVARYVLTRQACPSGHADQLFSAGRGRQPAHRADRAQPSSMSIRVLPRVFGFTRARSRNSATPSSCDRSSSR